MALNWPYSRQVVIDQNGDVAAGALAYFYSGGTTTPLTTYSDKNLTTPHPHPVVADAYGRFPRVFIDFVDYGEKVTTADGTQLWYDTDIDNPDPVEAAAGIQSDDEHLLATGDFIFSVADETRSGFVRANGRTIGNAASGATERANADTEDLFTFFWNKLGNTQAAVSGGRGASAAADYAANKTLTLPNGRMAGLFGLDTMGNSAGSYGTGVPFVQGDATTPGSLAGANTHALTTAELAEHLHAVSITTDSQGAHTHTYSGTVDSGGAHTHTGTTGGESNTHTHQLTTSFAFVPAEVGGAFSALSNGGGSQNLGTSSTNSTGHTHSFTTDSGGSHTHTYSGTTASNGAHTHSVSGNTANTGSGDAHNNMPRALLGTFYIKL